MGGGRRVRTHLGALRAEPQTRLSMFGSVGSSSPPSTGPAWVEQRTSIFSNPPQKETSPEEGPTSSGTPEAAQSWGPSRDFLPQKAETRHYPHCEVTSPWVQGMGEPNSVPGVKPQKEIWCLGVSFSIGRSLQGLMVQQGKQDTRANPTTLRGSAATSSEGGVPETTAERKHMWLRNKV